MLGPDPAPLRALCDSDEPLLAVVANSLASYVLERQGDVDGAIRAAEGMLDAFRGRGADWVEVLARTRISELSLQAERGEEGRRHLLAALRLMEGSMPWGDIIGVKAALILANLQLGAVDEAERWLPLTPPERQEETPEQQEEAEAETVGAFAFGLGMRAELLLARGEAEAGCREWRRAVGASDGGERAFYRTDPPGLEPWTLEIEAAAVVAHAHHGRLDLIAQAVRALPHKLWTMLSHPVEKPPAYLMDFPVCGALLLALAMVELDRAERTGDAAARTAGARLIALAERFRFLRGFQPTMA
ncbi:AfsR/SARP family transcriptional regulator, partial [Streptomyces sp. 2MCAF27]